MCSADGSMVSRHNAKIFRVLLRPIVGRPSHEPVGGGGGVDLTKLQGQTFFEISPKGHLFKRAERETM